MVKLFSKFKDKFMSEYEESDFPEEFAEDYVELDSKGDTPKAKIIVRPFVIDDFADVKPVLDSLREGYTIALINIKPLKDTDVVELKRAVNKLKKTCDAIDGDIAGFGEDWIVATPGFAGVHRENKEIGNIDE
ncbi:cell division protein SepF [archaeon]|jgi:SepF-like predicted cell division protein (DUF552 family)|nr:cell division protein SepF [archaeon]MBT6823873.1 cell division protein SepF [archaeon]MBT7107404.1 cell division protein SepF [archaeon]MBT7297202.1 cell division protein SepF [archaeon]